MIEFYGSDHSHTDRSNLRLRDSTNRLDQLCWYAADALHHDFIAITDHETVATAIDCQSVEADIRKKYPNFKVIRGNEIYLCRDGLCKENYERGKDKFWHFILLAKDAIGHRQIRELSTRAWLRAFETNRMKRVPTYYQDLKDIVGVESGHVIFSTACLGSFLAQQALDYQSNPSPQKYEGLKDWILNLIDICGRENFFLEVQPSHNREQIIVNNIYRTLSDDLNIPVVISLDAHYLKKEDEPIHHAFLTSQNGERETSEFYASTYMMSREEIHSYMDKYLGAETVSKWMNNTKKIYDMCEDYDLTRPLHIPYLPLTVNTITEEDFLEFKDKIKELEYFYTSLHKPDRDLAAAIITKIKSDRAQYDNQPTFEMIDDNLLAVRVSSDKQNTRWSAYLLNMRDYIDVIWSRGDSLVGPSRGSGGGFLLLQMLDITQINPLREKAPLRSWRFLNPERASVLDIDVDIEGGKRAQVYQALQDVYGHDRVSKVLTIRTEKSKSAILTAARGIGLDPDEAAYLASFIKSDRGQQRTLEQTYYGDEENDFAPDLKFRELMDGKYAKVWEVAKFISGLCCGVGSHAGGVIFYDEPITNSTALMQTTNDDIVTQYDLHLCQEVGLIKIDLLSIEALDKIRACLDLLGQYKYIPTENKTLKEIYEDTIGVYKIERNDPKMWQMIHEHKIESLFQMEQQSGIKGIAAAKPQNLEELAALNSVIRLMAQEKGGEQPIDKFARFKKDIGEWYREMDSYGVKPEHQKLLEPLLLESAGICEAQERLMSLVQLPEVGGYSLAWADKLRKAIAKKNPAAFNELQDEFYENARNRNLDANLCKYVWDVLICTSRGYGFNLAHTLSYSIVALQEMNLAYRFPILFWDVANLIVDSGAMNLTEAILDEDDSDDENLKNTSIDYGKIATAIGKMQSRNLLFSLPDINKSQITFSPDLENNKILYGIKGIAGVGNQLIKDILAARPFESIEDFLAKIKAKKTQMIPLIKSGAFDELYNHSRAAAMNEYIDIITDKKKRITLQNMQMLIAKGLIPEELTLEKYIFNFNKYIKKHLTKDGYSLDNHSVDFFSKNFDDSILIHVEINGNEKTAILPKAAWDNLYQKAMNPVRAWMKENQQQILEQLNQLLRDEVIEKYAKGSLSKWEMDSLSFYYHEHELANLNKRAYSIDDFTELKNDEVDYFFSKNRRQIPIYKIHRIAGTVIDKNKNKNMITLLTPSGVVTVKIWKNQFGAWDKQISEKDIDGKKHVLEKSWFTRGNKLIITGIRRDDTFIPKKYKNTSFPLFELIEEMDDKGFITKSQIERVEVEDNGNRTL